MRGYHNVIRATLHYGGEVHRVMNFRGILKFDWPRITLLSSSGSYYGQESFGGELCTWMKKDMTANVATFF